MVVEAISEDVETKRGLYEQLADVLDEDAVLATTTSSLSVAELAEASGRPDRFGALHVFNPVDKMKLVELSFPDSASEDTKKRLHQLCEELDKTAVEVPDAAGFVVNKLLFPYLFDAVRLLERDGLAPEAIDTCMKLGAGHPMGPLALLDFVGLDVSAAIGESIGTEIPDRVRELIAEGKLGRKAGQASTSTAEELGRRLLALHERGLARAAAPRRRRRHAAGEVPDHVGLADPLPLGKLGHAVPGKRGIGQVVPATELQCLERGGQSGSLLVLFLDQRPQSITLGIAQLHTPHAGETSSSEKHLRAKLAPLPDGSVNDEGRPAGPPLEECALGSLSERGTAPGTSAPSCAAACAGLAFDAFAPWALRHRALRARERPCRREPPRRTSRPVRGSSG